MTRKPSSIFKLNVWDGSWEEDEEGWFGWYTRRWGSVKRFDLNDETA